jgi:hypothetical protein
MEERVTDFSKRMFMGIPIEGSVTGTRKYTEQRPITDLYEQFQKAFASGVKAITWTQYTPYFNDGDVCKFSVGDHFVTTNDRVAASWLQEEFPDADDYEKEDSYREDSYWGYGKPWVGYTGTKYPHPDGITIEQWPELYIQDAAYEHAMLEAFGDHTQVVVTPEKVVQFEYEHE